jgi:hypothetical protein
MKYVWTPLLVVMVAAMASSMAFAQWVQVDYDEPLSPTSGPVATDYSEAAFGDVDTDHPFWGYIEELAAAATEAVSDGIVGGYGDGSYQPTWDVNRAAMAIFIARAAGYTDEVAGQTFKDVPEGFWAFTEIGQCVLNGVVSGYADYFPDDPDFTDAYLPTNAVTRAMMTVFVVRSAGLATAAYTAGFVDVDDTYWAAAYIQGCVDANIAAGYPDNFFRPDRKVNRGEMAVFVWRGLVDDVVLGSGATDDVALDPGANDTAAMFLADATAPTDAAAVDMAEGVFAYVALDSHMIAGGTITFEVTHVDDNGTPDDEEDDFVVVDGGDTVPVTAGDYDDEIDAGGLPNLIASYEVVTGLAAGDYTVSVELAGGAVLELGTFTK